MPPASLRAVNTCSGKSEDVVGFGAAALLLPAVEEAARHQQMRQHRQLPTGTTHPAGELGIPKEASLPQQQHVSLHTSQSGLRHSMSIPGATPPRRKRGFFLIALTQQTVSFLGQRLCPEHCHQSELENKVWSQWNKLPNYGENLTWRKMSSSRTSLSQAELSHCMATCHTSV